MNARKLIVTCCIAASAVFAQTPVRADAVAGSGAAANAGTGWQVAGTLGLLKFVVVSGERIHDRAFYDGAVAALCEPDATCFLRFFTNSTGAPIAMPLADAILAEPTASFQRSAKQNNEVFEWSCRMKMPGNCF